MFKRQLAGSLCLLFWPLLAPAQSKAPGILGPDGAQGIRPRRAVPAKTLREGRDERRRQKEAEENSSEGQNNVAPPEDAPANPDGAAPSAAQLKAKAPPPPPASAFFRWDLDLIYPKIVSSSSSWSAEPGVRLAFLARVGAQGASGRSLWLGVRVLSFSAQGRIGEQTARVGLSYFGPALAWEWLHVSEPAADEEEASSSRRQRLGLGFAALSRQGEQDTGSTQPQLVSRSLTIDAPGIWAEYTYAANYSAQCDWQVTGGLQIGTGKLLLYMGLGVDLWLGEPS